MTPYFQVIPLLVNLLNVKAIFSGLHEVLVFQELKLMILTIFNCHNQEPTLVAGILAQEVIVVFKNSNILIEIKALPLLFLPH